MTNPANKLLVVDPSPTASAAIQDQFSRLGYKTFGSVSSQAAIEVVQKERPDVMIMNPNAFTGHLSAFVKTAQAFDTGYKKLKFFALTRLPYDPASLQAIAEPQVKVITVMMPMADVCRIIQGHVLGFANPINYRAGLFRMVLEASDEIFGFHLRENLTIDQGGYKKAYDLTGQVFASIALTGDFINGTLAISCDRPFGDALATAMLGTTTPLSDAEITDLYAEIINQMAGLLQGKMGEHNVRVTLGLPRALYGNQLQFVHPGANRLGQIGLTVSGNAVPSGLLSRLLGTAKGRTVIEFCFDGKG
ncbi:hypothetical protein E3A20_09600 [Planctomyces bekefii]|uniref:Chemotaxis phosphatase CheX-like domain-containing protein n=1 Tax=Planctomyces bekefii TaxID=1653850 RepID=A0A5C6M6X2_9PLAN|nr:hypothetical protein E3A20_09600 [Planctomyces bekefii]